jgi:hypothetical protein
MKGSPDTFSGIPPDKLYTRIELRFTRGAVSPEVAARPMINRKKNTTRIPRAIREPRTLATRVEKKRMDQSLLGIES